MYSSVMESTISVASCREGGEGGWGDRRVNLTQAFPIRTGMAALDSKASGKMGMRAVVYYMTTTIVAVFIGIIMVLIVHPGKGSKDEFTRQQKIEQVSAADAFLDLIRYLPAKGLPVLGKWALSYNTPL